MKQASQTAFFLISILSVFIVGTDALVATQSHQQDLVLEEHRIGEERDFCSVTQNAQGVDSEISGGNPGVQLAAKPNSVLKDYTALVVERETNFNGIQKYVYTGKVALYLRYQSIKIPS